MTDMDDTRSACILACALVIACMIPCSPAESQSPDRALVAAAIGECGLHGPDAEACWAGVTGVHVERARRLGMRPATMARVYSAALRRCRRAWVCELARSDARPVSWPARASWDRARVRIERARVVVAAAIGGEGVCTGGVHHGSLELDAVPRGHVEACRYRTGRHHQVVYRRESDDV